MDRIVTNEGYPVSLQATQALAVTPHDTNEISLLNPNTGHSSYGVTLYVGGAGNVAVTTIGGDAVTFSNVPAGTFLPVIVKIVKSTGTTATSIVALA